MLRRRRTRRQTTFGMPTDIKVSLEFNDCQRSSSYSNLIWFTCKQWNAYCSMHPRAETMSRRTKSKYTFVLNSYNEHYSHFLRKSPASTSAARYMLNSKHWRGCAERARSSSSESVIFENEFSQFQNVKDPKRQITVPSNY